MKIRYTSFNKSGFLINNSELVRKRFMHYGFFGSVKHVGSLSKLLEVTKRCHIGLPNFGIEDSFQ